jgi:hypothetical protein
MAGGKAELRAAYGAEEGAAMSSRTDHTGQATGLVRVTVNLTQRSWQALHQAVKLTGDSKTDTINRAIQMYAYVENVRQEGGELYVRTSDKELERLVFF